MNFRSYVDWVNTRWVRWNRGKPNALAVAALGLAGEAGEVTEHFKKHLRDGTPIINNKALILELGDVLHYWLALCWYAQVDPDEVMLANIQKLNERDIQTGVDLAAGPDSSAVFFHAYRHKSVGICSRCGWFECYGKHECPPLVFGAALARAMRVRARLEGLV